jgi:hypothetical protein
MIVPGFYWKWEPVVKGKVRLYHTSDKCPVGRRIPVIKRGYDYAEHKHCPVCLKLNCRRK